MAVTVGVGQSGYLDEFETGEPARGHGATYVDEPFLDLRVHPHVVTAIASRQRRCLLYTSRCV